MIDYDLNSGKYTIAKHDQKQEFDHIFRLNDRSIIITFHQSRNTISAKILKNAETFDDILITVPADKIKLFKKISGKTPESVNQAEFVKNGSIGELKAYFSGRKLTYTLEKGKSDMQIFQFDLSDKNDFLYHTIDMGFVKETKEIASYVVDDKLVVVSTEKEDVKVKAFDIQTGKEGSVLSVKENLGIHIGNEQLTAYLKGVSKAAMKPTVTVNKTTDHNLAVRIDQVNETEYVYHYNWWFHQWFFHQQIWHQQQMMRHMQMSMPRGGFGPSARDYEANTGFMTKEKEKTIPLEFVIRPDFKSVFEGESNLLFPEIDKDKYTDTFKDDKNIKEFSSEFAEAEMRYIYLDRKAKTIKIASVELL